MPSRLLVVLEKQSKFRIVALCIILSFSIGVADYLTGPEISSGIFYILPISVAVWFGNKNLSLLFAILASIIWFICDMEPDRSYSHQIIGYWNALVRLTFFLIITNLLWGFRQKLREEEIFADTDPLTGALNKRAFYEQVAREIERSKRFQRPFSISYIDLDNFKTVNDTYGHAIGDDLLKTVVNTINENTRKIDIVSRIGGDEFAVMLIGTTHKNSDPAIRKIQNKLLARMKLSKWPVTFSIGIVTFEKPPQDVDTAMDLADTVMYGVKKSSKNNIAHIIWPKESS